MPMTMKLPFLKITIWIAIINILLIMSLKKQLTLSRYIQM